MKDFEIINLQYFQELHDSRYHIDIYSKPLIGRLTHLCNHLVKYSASDLKRVSTYSDALACLLSMGNALNVNLSKALEIENQDATFLSQIKPMFHPSVLKEQYQITLGNMAKLLEGYDHVESLQYKEQFKQLVVRILMLLIHMRNELDEMSTSSLQISYINKIFDLKEKHIFYPYYHNLDLSDPTYRSFVAFKNVNK